MNMAANAKAIVRDRWIVDIAGSLLYVRGVNGVPGGDRELRPCIDGAHPMRALPDWGRMALSWNVASILLGPLALPDPQSPRIANRSVDTNRERDPTAVRGWNYRRSRAGPA